MVARTHAAVALLLAAALAVGAAPTDAGAAGGTVAGGASVDDASTAPANPAAGAAHGNHLRADAQLTADGTVVVETAFLLEDGYVAIHATNETGQPGAVLAHRRLGSGFHSPVELQVDPAVWADRSEPVRLWAVLHADDGDGTFEPEGDDRALRSFGSLSGSRFRVDTADGDANVVAASFSARRTTGTVTLPRVSVPADGYVVLTDDDTGEPAGHAALPAGTHENVSVALSESYLRSVAGDPRVYLRATLYRDDGDGAFDPATDEQVRVGEQPIASVFSVRVPDSAAPGNGSGTTTALVNTPSPTTARTPTATATATATTTTTDDGSSAGAPGFGAATAVAGLLAAAVLAVRRRGED